MTYKYPSDSRLWLALRLPDLAFNALGLGAQTAQAIAVSERKRVIWASPSAQAAGVAYGMDITTAQLLSHCEIHNRNIALEQKALEQLAERMYQFTPYIEHYFCQTQASAGLILELSRCLKLFSGLIKLTTQLFESLANTHYSFNYGLAHSIKGAWLLSHQTYKITGDENKQLFCERLKLLPVNKLYDYPQVVEALEKTGFETLGQIAHQIDVQSIASIKKRFGQNFAECLCEIFGIEQNFQQSSLFTKPVRVHQPIETFSESVQFDYPITQTDQLHWPIENLLQKLSEYLRKRQLESQDIKWQLYDIYRNQHFLSVHCDHPQSHWQLFYDLTLIQLEQSQLPFEVDTLVLTCAQAGPVQNRNQLLRFDNSRKSDARQQSFAVTTAKLKARLGDAAVFKLSYRDSHLPEVTQACIPPGTTCHQQLPLCQAVALRPNWFFKTPIPLETRQQGLYWHGYLSLIAGPERIQSCWWDKPAARDYFMAQRHDNVRLWIFFDLHQKCWYAQGVFA